MSIVETIVAHTDRVCLFFVAFVTTVEGLLKFFQFNLCRKLFPMHLLFSVLVEKYDVLCCSARVDISLSGNFIGLDDQYIDLCTWLGIQNV